MSIAIVSLLILVVVVIIGIPILARVFGEAASRGEDEQGSRDTGRDDEDDGGK